MSRGGLILYASLERFCLSLIGPCTPAHLLYKGVQFWRLERDEEEPKLSPGRTQKVENMKKNPKVENMNEVWDSMVFKLANN